MITFPTSTTSYTYAKFVVYSLAGSQILTDLQYIPLSIQFTSPKVVIGGFIGVLKDIRFFSGTVTNAIIKTGGSANNYCVLKFGSAYNDLTSGVSVSATNAYCTICDSTTSLNQELGTCASPNSSDYVVDPNTNTYRFVGSAPSLKPTIGTTLIAGWNTGCSTNCSACYSSSNNSCISCSTNAILNPYDESCVITCPTNFVSLDNSTTSVSRTMCYPPEWVALNATLTAADSTFFVIQFNQNVQPNPPTGIDFVMTNGDQTNSTLLANTSSAYAVLFKYSNNMLERVVTATFSKPTQITTASTKGGSISLDSDFATLYARANATSVITKAEQDKLNTLSTVLDILLYCCIGFVILFTLTDNLWIVWSMSDAFQLLNYLLYMEFVYPFNVDRIFQRLGIFNFRFIPSIINTAGGMDTFPNQATNSPFKDYGYKSASFIFNCTNYMIVYAFMTIVSITTLMLCKVKYREISTQDTMHKVHLIVKIIFLRVFTLSYLEITMALIIQMANINLDDPANIASFLIAILFGGTVVFVIPLYFMWTIHKTHMEGSWKDNHDSAFADLLVEYDRSTFLSRNFPFFLLIRKAVIVPIVIFLKDIAIFQIGFTINLTLNVLLWFFVQKIYRKWSYVFINVVIEIGIFAVCASTLR